MIEYVYIIYICTTQHIVFMYITCILHKYHVHHVSFTRKYGFEGIFKNSWIQENTSTISCHKWGKISWGTPHIYGKVWQWIFCIAKDVLNLELGTMAWHPAPWHRTIWGVIIAVKGRQTSRMTQLLSGPSGGFSINFQTFTEQFLLDTRW